MVDKETILSLFTVLFACFSYISCICVCVSISNRGYKPCQSKQRKKKIHQHLQLLNPSIINKPQPNQPNIILFWMCIVDGLHMLPVIANWFPQMISTDFWYPTQCTVIGVVAQFCGLQGASWHILLAYYLGYILSGGDLQKKLQIMHQQRYIYYLLVNLIPLIGTIIPFLMDSQNGYHINIMDGDKDCWVIGHSQYVFITAIIITLIFHYSVLLISFIQLRKSNYKKYQIIFKLSKFVIVYTVIRFFPLIERIYEIFDKVPYWLILLQHLSIASLGMGNALVWFWNSNPTKVKKIKKQRKPWQTIDLWEVYSINTPTSINNSNMNNDQWHMIEAGNNYLALNKSFQRVSSDKVIEQESDIDSHEKNIYSIKHEIHDIKDW